MADHDNSAPPAEREPDTADHTCLTDDEITALQAHGAMWPIVRHIGSLDAAKLKAALKVTRRFAIERLAEEVEYHKWRAVSEEREGKAAHHRAIEAKLRAAIDRLASAGGR